MCAPLTTVCRRWEKEVRVLPCSIGKCGDKRMVVERRPAIITSQSTSNSRSSRGFLKKRLMLQIMGSALISSFVSSVSLCGASSGRGRTMNVSSSKMNQKDQKR